MKNSADPMFDQALQEYLSEIEELPTTASLLDSITPLSSDEQLEYQVELQKRLFVERVLQRMDVLGISKAELARRLSASRQYVARSLNEEEPANFTIESIVTLANALGLKASVMMTEPNMELCECPRRIDFPSTNSTDRQEIARPRYDNRSGFRPQKKSKIGFEDAEPVTA